MSELVYIPGKPAISAGLLTRFLPPIPEGIAASWLGNNLPKGSLVLDPFGSHPVLPVEAARSKYKILVSVNNPIARFLIELAAHPPGKDDLCAALAELVSTRVGSERLEVHLKQLYMTTCTQCSRPVMAHAFVWERNSFSPQAKIYECHYCGDAGEYPVTQSDINLANSFSASSLHKLRVLERIAPPGDPNRKQVEEALSIYSPRALYILVTVINRIESLLASQRNTSSGQAMVRKSLIALALSALDKGNNLWTYPSGRTRPKQLSPSPRFYENNILIALEEAANQLGENKSHVPYTIYPKFPENDHGIILYEGPLRELIQDLYSSTDRKTLSFDAVLTALPRHNQAYWTLSALWAGWIWGHESISSFKSVLRRRRYDWAWYSSAIYHAFNSLVEYLPSRIPFFGLIGDAETHFISASIVPAASTGFTLKGIALRAESGLAQILWDQEQQLHYKSDISSPGNEQRLKKLIVSNGVSLLKQKGEPAPYLTLYTNALETIVDNCAIAFGDQIKSDDEYNRIHSLIEDTITDWNGFIRYGGSEKSPETSRLWHQEIIKPDSSLSDRVEYIVRDYLVDNPGCSLYEIDKNICSQFPGLTTPAPGLIYTCVDSYSKKDLLMNLTLRAQDNPLNREHELKSMRTALKNLGVRLGFSSVGEDPIIWSDPENVLYLAFYVISSAAIGEIIFSAEHPPDRSLIVLPGARANIILYKLQHNPYLKEKFERGWRFLKFRQLRHLINSPSLSQNNLESLLAVDPLTESPAQMRFL
jgi:hypothetical protein